MNGKTFRNWKCTLDPNGCYLKGEIVTVNNNAIRAWCGICSKHVECICCFHNFSEVFVTGISGSTIKSDALTKHM